MNAMINEPLKKYYELTRSSSLFQEYYQDYPDYADAPVLDKGRLVNILNTKFDLHSESTGVYLVRSGGSTRKPLVFPVDIEENLEQRRILARALTENKVISPRTIALNILGYMDMYRTAAIIDDILEKCQATTLAMSTHATYEDDYQAILNFNPDIIFCTPSKLFHFADHLKKNGLKVSVKNMLYGGEFLLDSYAQVFKEYIGTEQIYSLFGSAETGMWAWCDYTNQPSLFRYIDGILPEIINPDTDGYGNIVITNLYRKRFPVFRYSIGDIGRLVVIDNVSYLEIKTREKGSFMLYESNYSLNDFTEVFHDVDNFQIQLSTNEDLHVDVKFLLRKDLQETERKLFEDTKYKLICDILGYKIKNTEVISGPDVEFYINPVTCKMPQIVDFRK